MYHWSNLLYSRHPTEARLFNVQQDHKVKCGRSLKLSLHWIRIDTAGIPDGEEPCHTCIRHGVGDLCFRRVRKRRTYRRAQNAPQSPQNRYSSASQHVGGSSPHLEPEQSQSPPLKFVPPASKSSSCDQNLSRRRGSSITHMDVFERASGVGDLGRSSPEGSGQDSGRRSSSRSSRPPPEQKAGSASPPVVPGPTNATCPSQLQ